MSETELQERLRIIETLITEYQDRLLDLQKEQAEVMKEISEYEITNQIIAENETLIEKD